MSDIVDEFFREGLVKENDLGSAYRLKRLGDLERALENSPDKAYEMLPYFTKAMAINVILFSPEEVVRDIFYSHWEDKFSSEELKLVKGGKI